MGSFASPGGRFTTMSGHGRVSGDGPGPGSYDPSVKDARDRSPAYTIGAKREESRRNDSPGPGAYEAGDGKDPVRSFTISGRHDDPSSDVPGPG
jgi:hypothetical protein